MELPDDAVTKYGRERWRLGFVVGLAFGLLGASAVIAALHVLG